MSDQSLPFTEVEHPAPHRHRVGLLALGFGIVGAPLAWDIELLAGVALSGRQCYPSDSPLAIPMWEGTWWFLLTMSFIAIAVGLFAALVAWRNWQRTHDESPKDAYSGDGRTRFMALCGLLSSGLFLVALVFTMAILFLVPLCNG